MKPSIKTSHGIAILTACLLIAILFITQSSKQLDTVARYIQPNTQLAQVSGTGSPVAIIQSAIGSNNFGGLSNSNTFTSSVVAGNTVVVLIQWYNYTGQPQSTPTSVTDSRGNTYTIVPAATNQIVSKDYSGIATAMAYATNIQGGSDAITVTWNSRTDGSFVSIYELSPSTFDQVVKASGTGANPSTGSITTAMNGGMAFLNIIGGETSAGYFVSYNLSSGWTQSLNTGGGYAHEVTAYMPQVSAGVITGNLTQATPSTYAISAATFAPSGGTTSGGSGTVTPPATPATCTSFTYSAWSLCTNSSQSRTVISSSPSSCTGGSPITTQSCTVTPTPPQTTTSANIYISQSGTGLGSSCADPLSVSWFNTSANWGTGSTQIGPGKTVHLCGTISTALTVQGSGASGNPITILFEPNAKMSAPVFLTAIDATGQSYITIDGGTNGIMENTDNGTALGHHTASTMIQLTGGNNQIVQNLIIRNIYVRTPYSTDTNGGNIGIKISGSNVIVRHNNITQSDDLITAIYGTGMTSNLTIDSNILIGTNHAITVGSGGVANPNYSNITISNNHIDGMDVWDVPAGDLNFHRNGIFMFNESPDKSGSISNVNIYGNSIGPGINPQASQLNTAGTGGIFLDAYRFSQFQNINIYNNLLG